MTGNTRNREAGELFGPRFELFSDVMLLGITTAVVSIPLLTAPAALSTACEVLHRRTLYGEPAGARRYLAVLRGRLRGGDVSAGLVLIVLAALGLADVLLATAGLPGAGVFCGALALVAVVAVVVVVGLRACAAPASRVDWRTAVRTAAARTADDLPGSALILLAAATCVACVWMLPPLVLLVPGPLALALTAVVLRTSSREQHVIPSSEAGS